MICTNTSKNYTFVYFNSATRLFFEYFFKDFNKK